MTENCAKVINQLVVRRRQIGMTQKELAGLSDLKQSVVSRFENKGAVPQLDTLVKIASALGCRIEVIPESE